jgi:hypothetical protein
MSRNKPAQRAFNDLQVTATALREEWAMDTYVIAIIIVSALCLARMYLILSE